MDHELKGIDCHQFIRLSRGSSTSAAATFNGHGRKEETASFSPNMESMHQQLRNLTLMQMNGRQVLNPPEDWLGSPPTSACELFIRRIPKDLDGQKLMEPFLRFGQIYEIRLPMDFNQANRGYAYIKYTNEDDAACAMEVLSHYYIRPQRKLEILHSYEKCRLFVNNIPRHLTEGEIEEKMRVVFPTMQRVFTRGGGGASCNSPENQNTEQVDCTQTESGVVDTGLANRGHVFIHFPSHAHALEAKKRTSPGLIRMWGRDLKVVWANTERDADMSKATKTLFVRNVDLSVNNRDIIDMLTQYVPRTTIRKISKVRTTAFFDFTTREAAEFCLQQLQGSILRGHRLDLEWAKPSEQQSLHRMRNTDFDAVLRLKCIANEWMLPVVLFGTHYEREGLQYGAVALRNANNVMHAVYLIMQPHELVDIHSRMCEVVCVLIEAIGSFPDCNYVFHVQRDSAHLIGIVVNSYNFVEFIASCGVPTDMYFDLNEIIDLTWGVTLLANANEDMLIKAYQESFRAHTVCTYLQSWVTLTNRIFGTIMPKYRNKAPLKYDLNDTQIVLALCFVSTGTNSMLPTRPYTAFPISSFANGFEGLSYITLKLLPIALTQSRFVESNILSHVIFGSTQYYHPAQRIMIPPIWVSCYPYSVSIKQPQRQCETKSKEQEKPIQIKKRQQPQPPQQPEQQNCTLSASIASIGAAAAEASDGGLKLNTTTVDADQFCEKFEPSKIHSSPNLNEAN